MFGLNNVFVSVLIKSKYLYRALSCVTKSITHSKMIPYQRERNTFLGKNTHYHEYQANCLRKHIYYTKMSYTYSCNMIIPIRTPYI